MTESVLSMECASGAVVVAGVRAAMPALVLTLGAAFLRADVLGKFLCARVDGTDWYEVLSEYSLLLGSCKKMPERTFCVIKESTDPFL